MGKTDHLTTWEQQAHKADPEGTGCLKKHQDYFDTQYKNCNYRKLAHDYSKDAEKGIYNVPTPRAPERWIRALAGEGLKPTLTKKGKEVSRSKPADLFDEHGNPTHAWDLHVGANFTEWKTPYWHNTHHVIAAGEIGACFSENERRVIVAAKWNINTMPNIIILPKQRMVAAVLKLPTHVPPDGKQEHDKYSEKIGNGLNSIKAKLNKNAEDSAHELTDETAPKCCDEFKRVASEIRSTLIEAGEKNPGVNLDSLALDAVRW